MEHSAYLREALSRYPLEKATPVFIRHNENITYRIDAAAGQYLLRIHKPMEGFSLGIFGHNGVTKEDLALGELQTLLHLEQCGFPAQRPLKNREGQALTTLSDSTLVTMLSWIPGGTLEEIQMTADLGQQLGHMIGALHVCLQDANPAQIKRYSYDRRLLEKMEAEIKSAHRLGHMQSEHEIAICRAIHTIEKTMTRLDEMPEMKGLNHADLSFSNTLLSRENAITPIDFSLSGYGYHAMDIGMVLSQHKDAEIQRSILTGYEAHRNIEVDLQAIHAFYALSVLLFIACQHHRFYQDDWYGPSLDRWCNTVFRPLANGERFIMI